MVLQIRNQAEVTANNGDKASIDIPARTITSSKRQSNCPLKYKLEMEVPRWNEWDQSYYGHYEEVRNGPYGDNLSIDLTNLNAVLSISQQEFLDDWSVRFAHTTDDGEFISLKFQYTAWDPSEPEWNNKIYDEFTVEVRSSLETKSNFCDWTALSIDEPVSGTRTYDIVESTREPEL